MFACEKNLKFKTAVCVAACTETHDQTPTPSLNLVGRQASLFSISSIAQCDGAFESGTTGQLSFDAHQLAKNKFVAGKPDSLLPISQPNHNACIKPVFDYPKIVETMPVALGLEAVSWAAGWLLNTEKNHCNAITSSAEYAP